MKFVIEVTNPNQPFKCGFEVENEAEEEMLESMTFEQVALTLINATVIFLLRLYRDNGGKDDTGIIENLQKLFRVNLLFCTPEAVFTKGMLKLYPGEKNRKLRQELLSLKVIHDVCSKMNRA